MNTRKKYIKYKNKYINLKGGYIANNDILLKIKSIGFEFETSKMSPFHIVPSEYPIEDLNTFNKHQIDLFTDYFAITKEEASIKYNSLADYPILKSIVKYKISSDILNNSLLINNNIKTPNAGLLNNSIAEQIFLVTSDDINDEIQSDQINKILNNNILYSEGIYLDNEKIINLKSDSILDNYTPFRHTEFHFTFTHINNNNAIYYYLNQCIITLESYFSKLTQDMVTIKNEKESYIRNLNGRELPNIITNKAILYYNENHAVFYIIPNWLNQKNINSIRWVIQLTFGILLEDIIEVIDYLACFNTRYEPNWISAKTNAQYVIDSFVSIYTINKDNDIIKRLLNFLTIFIYETQLIKDVKSDGNANKYLYSFLIRHDYHTIFPKLFEYHEQWKEFINNTNLIINSKNLSQNYTEVFFQLLQNFISDNPTSTLKISHNKSIKYKNCTKHYPYKGIVLIEFRSFYKHLSKEINKNSSQFIKPSISELKDFLETKLKK